MDIRMRIDYGSSAIRIDILPFCDNAKIVKMLHFVIILAMWNKINFSWWLKYKYDYLIYWLLTIVDYIFNFSDLNYK